MAVGCKRPRRAPGAAPAGGVGAPVLGRSWWRRQMRRWRGAADGGGGGIIAGTAMTMDTDAAIIVAGSTPQGEGGGRRGGGDVGQAIEGVRRLRPSSWPSPSSTSAIVDVGHCHGRQLIGHRRGHLRCRHRPSSTSAIVAVVDEWDMW
jgi:hypothetical protein